MILSNDYVKKNHEIAISSGFVSRTNQIIEEMSELTKVLCKFNRYISGDKTIGNKITPEILENDMIEEVADVYVVLQQIIYLIGEEKIKRIAEQKIDRTLGKLNQKG